MKKRPLVRKQDSKLSFIHKLLINKWGRGSGLGGGAKTPQARISADFLFKVLAVSLILHLLSACSSCEEQKQIVLILCLVKQVVSTFKAHAVWLKATGSREGEKQER